MIKIVYKILVLFSYIILFIHCKVIEINKYELNYDHNFENVSTIDVGTNLDSNITNSKSINSTASNFENNSKLIDNSNNKNDVSNIYNNSDSNSNSNSNNNNNSNYNSSHDNSMTLKINQNVSDSITSTALPAEPSDENSETTVTAETTLIPNTTTEIQPKVSLEDQLIPPANVTPNIGFQNVTEDGTNMHLFVLDSDCPSLQNADKLSQTQLVERLTHGCRYDRLERPMNNNNGTVNSSPVSVYGRAYIYFMQNLEAHDLQFKIHALLQLRFVDPRLAFKSVSPLRKHPILGETQLREKIWIPHIFFANERDSNILGTDAKDVLTSINPDGTVIISQRIQATLYCWMNLQKFPFDKQKCSTILESWMHTTDELILYWEEKSPIALSPDFHLTEFSLLNITQSEAIVNADLSDLRHGAFAGNYSSLRFTIYLEREMGFYIMDYFLPSMMIVTISWVSFWLQADQSAPRIMLGTSTMLTFITLASAQGKTLPKVSYIKVSEIWFLGCTGFIFGSLVEFAFVNTIWRRKKNVALKEKNSKYILKATLTPRPARKEMNALHKSRSCSSLDGSAILNEPNGPGGFNNYLTVHAFPSKDTTIPVIKTESCDDLALATNQTKDNGHININLEPMNKSTQNIISGSASTDEVNKGWTTMTPQEISIWIDRRARLLFPSAFVVFNFFFWTFVLLS